MSDEPKPMHPADQREGRISDTIRAMGQSGGMTAGVDPDVLLILSDLEYDLVPGGKNVDPRNPNPEQKEALTNILWALFSKHFALTNLSNRKFWILQDWVDLVTDLYAAGFNEAMKIFLVRLYTFLKSTVSIKGFGVMSATQRSLNVKYETPFEEKKGGLFNFGPRRNVPRE